MVAKAADDPSEVALHSSRIGEPTMLAAVGEVPQRMIQIYGRWKSLESSKDHTRNNPEDAVMVSRKLLIAKTGKIEPKQPGQGAVWDQIP